MLKVGYYTIIAIGLLLFIGSAICSESQPHQADPSGLYANTIDTLILKCENKIGYRHSRSNEMQLVAALSVMKSAYLREYKTELIQEMKLKNIDPIDYKVNYFINSHFFKITQKSKPRYSTHLVSITN